MRAGAVTVAVFAMVTAAHSAVIHVKPTGNDANSGASWAEAKQTVGAAIQAGNANDEIWVAAGVYNERIRNKVAGGLSVDMALYGGFAGSESSRDERNIAANVTILDGGAGGSVVTIDSLAGPQMRIDGFRIRNGQAIFGGGIQITGAAPTIENNDLLGNQADHGGAIMVWAYRTIPPAAHARIASNVIQVNRGGSGGGGIAVVGASPEIRSNVLLRNTTGGYGGGIGVWVTDSSKIARPWIVSNFVYENAANLTTSGMLVGGGGIFATQRNIAGEPVSFGISAPRIEDNVVAANSAIACGGGIAFVYAYNESAPITNNTVVVNSGSGICWGLAGPTIVNNLVAYNTWGFEEDVGNPYPRTIRFNDVYGNNVHGELTNYFQLADLTGTDGNISAEPGLAWYGDGRLHLQPGSPCVDSGDDAAAGVGRVDMDGQPRVLGAHVDLGADESDGSTWPNLPVVIRVSPTGNDTNDGSTWALAKATVQNAIDAAWMAGGGEVWAREGTYVGHVTLSAWVRAYGGFAGTETQRSQRDPSAHVSVLHGNNIPPVVSCGLSGYRVGGLDGFKITGGGAYTGGTSIPPPSSPAGQGGGIRCAVSSPEISGNEIVQNSLGDPSTTPMEGPGVGGGISLIGSHALVRSNRIAQNEVLNRSSTGAGVYCEWSVVDLWYNRIESNHAPEGSGVYCMTARPMLFNNLVQSNENYYLPPVYFGSSAGAVALHLCWDLDLQFNYFVSNVADAGGALYIDQPYRGTIASNLFLGNHAYIRQLSTGGEGGALWLLIGMDTEEPLQVVGNTFSGNTATSIYAGEQGGAMAVLPASSAATIANNLLAFNSSGIYQRSGFSTNPVLVRNGMYNGSWNYVGLPAGATDVVADPLFVNLAGGNYRLQSGSPMVDQGNPAYVATSIDLDGAPRVQDANYDGAAVVDIGAYEYSPDFDGDGTPDWLDTDDDNDGAPDQSDCAPLDPAAWTWTLPVEGARATGRTPTVFSWTGQGSDVRYDVAAGSVSAMRLDGGFGRAVCEQSNGAGTGWPDPAPGDGRYYVVRAGNSCGNGGWGEGRSVTACP